LPDRWRHLIFSKNPGLILEGKEKMRTVKLWAMLMAVSLILVFPWSCTAGKDVPRLDQKTLKSWLSDPQVVILDVRKPKHWNASGKKIKGALRQDPQDVKAWAASLPKDKKIVLYCA
jgi:hypothetical protein